MSMPCERYQASPIGSSLAGDRRPRVWTGWCSRSRRTSPCSSAWRAARTRSWSARASRYSTTPRLQTRSSDAGIRSRLLPAIYPLSMERASLTRLRWRLRGAWMWPAFVVVTVVDALLLHALPVATDGIGGVPALLLSGFLNLFVVAVVAPLSGRLVRRRRPDLPKA